MPLVRRLAPWQWLLGLLALYWVLAEALRLWLGLLWAERVGLVLAALGVWAFINGRFIFAYYHALTTSFRVRRLPSYPEPQPGTTSSSWLPTRTTRCWRRRG